MAHYNVLRDIFLKFQSTLIIVFSKVLSNQKTVVKTREKLGVIYGLSEWIIFYSLYIWWHGAVGVHIMYIILYINYKSNQLYKNILYVETVDWFTNKFNSLIYETWIFHLKSLVIFHLNSHSSLTSNRSQEATEFHCKCATWIILFF